MNRPDETQTPRPASDAGADLTEQTVLEHRPGVPCAFEPRDGSVAIITSYNELKGPTSIGRALQFVCAHRLFCVGHLPGLRDGSSRLTLARRLIREGFLKVSSEPAPASPVEIAATGPGQRGRLVVAGSGIRSFAQLTVETLGWLDLADVVMYCVSDPATGAFMRETYPESVDLGALYHQHLSRFDVYDAMVETMLAPVRAGKLVCSVYYGHPGVFVMPTHRAVEIARGEGFAATMLAGVSATDCLYAELGSDPSAAGCQYYEATDLLVHRRPLHPENNVVIWQIGVVGNTTSKADRNELAILIEYLEQFYEPDCRVLHYQGSVFPGCESVVEWLPLAELGKGARVTSMSTLYIPAQKKPSMDAEMAFRLGLVKGSDPAEKAAERSAEKTDERAAAGAPQAAAPPPLEYGPLARLFHDCARHPALLLELERDTDRVAEKAGLTPDETVALRSRMPGRIWAAIESFRKKEAPAAVSTATAQPPHPDPPSHARR